MKRGWFALLLLVLGAAGGHALYRHYCPRVAEVRCTMQWLGSKLELSPEQFARIEAIHKRHQPEIRYLDTQCRSCEPTQREESKRRRKAATKFLIKEVCGELDPRQKSIYLSLVAPCGREESKRP